MKITNLATLMFGMKGNALNNMIVNFLIMMMVKLNRGWEKEQPQKKK
jgi:hypothetical protein